MDFEILTGRKHSDFIHYQGFLIHKEALLSFQKLQESASKDIGAELRLVSSFRDYERQKLIWDSKAQGHRTLLDDHGEELKFSDLNNSELLKGILRFSAIPGASRHHWGTDFDIFDARFISKDKLQLTHAECVGDGPCAELHTWLDEYLVTTDFYRPYEFDQGGVAVEKWHLSFKPLSEKYLDAYRFEIFLRNLNESNIELKHILLADAEFYYKQYFLNQRQ